MQVWLSRQQVQTEAEAIQLLVPAGQVIEPLPEPFPSASITVAVSMLPTAAAIADLLAICLSLFCIVSSFFVLLFLATLGRCLTP